MEDAINPIFTVSRQTRRAVQAGTPMAVRVEDTREEWHCQPGSLLVRVPQRSCGGGEAKVQVLPAGPSISTVASGASCTPIAPNTSTSAPRRP